jgi:hypothetical protein
MKWIIKIFQSFLSRFKKKRRKLSPTERDKLIENLRKKRYKKSYF